MVKLGTSSRVKYNLLLLIALVFLFFLNFYEETLFYRPSLLHQWRQTDCLSITKNYYEQGMHFLSPKVHTQRMPDGKAVSELPLLNYTVAFLWKIFGEHEYIYRLLEYLIYLTGIFVLFNTLIRFFHRPWFAFFSVAFLLTSPLLTYYSFNFISDVPALSFCIMSFCFLIRFYKTKSLWCFYLSLLLAALAILLKASALIALVCLTFLAIIDLLNLNRLFKLEKLFKNKIVPVLSIMLAFFLINAWYNFALHYNTFDNGIFLLKIVPIWEMDGEMILDNLRALFNIMLPTFLNTPMLALYFLMVLFVIFHLKTLDRFLGCCFIFSGLFFILYILVFFKVFNVHDYYLINLFIFPVITFFSVTDILVKLDVTAGAFMKTACLLLFVFNGFYSAAFYRVRMIEGDALCDWYPFLSGEDKGFFTWQRWNYENNLKPLEDIRPDLRALNIRRENLVVTFMDDSPNISLYFMDQKGYTISLDQMKDSMAIKKLLPKHIQYLVLTRPDLKSEKAFKLVEDRLTSIYNKSHIEIFRIKR